MRVLLPGLWHGFNNVTPSECGEHYEAEAYDWIAVHNWAYDFTRPTIEEIVQAYLSIHGPEEHKDNIDDDEGDEDEEHTHNVTRLLPARSVACMRLL